MTIGASVMAAELFPCFGIEALGMCAYNPAQPSPTYFTLGNAVATLAFTAGVNAVAFDEKDFVLSAVANATTVVQGDVLEVRSVPVGGTGLVDPGGTVTIEIGRG